MLCIASTGAKVLKFPSSLYYSVIFLAFAVTQNLRPKRIKSVQTRVKIHSVLNYI